MDKERLSKIVQTCGVEFYDAETVVEGERKIFRVYIHSASGVTIDKCEEVSKILSPIFDVEPPVGGNYVLEVSSPGIERSLKNPEHFKMSVGELVKIRAQEGIKCEGKLLEADDEGVVIEGCEKVKYENISRARTYFVW